MTPAGATDRIRSARANLRAALGNCGKTEPRALERVLQLLQQAAGEMRLAEAEIRAGRTAGIVEIRRESAALKREIACMMRAIDGCAALYRGLSVRLEGAPLAYTCQGRTIPPRPAATCEMRG